MTSTLPIPLAPDRPNSHIANLVEAALELQQEDGTQAAAALLTDAGASFAMIGRVLCDKVQLRSR